VVARTSSVESIIVQSFHWRCDRHGCGFSDYEGDWLSDAPVAGLATVFTRQREGPAGL